MSSHERQVVITAPDNAKIYTTIGVPTKPTKKIVVFVHGLASTELWPPILLGSWYFRKHGFAYCRINLYDWRQGARTLMKSDLRQHSRDTDTVVRYLKRRGYNSIYAVGHSFGGLTLLQSTHQAFKAMSLWDISSFLSFPPTKWFQKDRHSGARYMVGAFRTDDVRPLSSRHPRLSK